MVQELRRIILDSNEICVALEAYSRMSNGFLPPGHVSQCKPVNGTDIEVVIETSPGSQDKATTKTLKNTDLLNPIIRFCIENNIMLPRHGQKTITTSEGKIILCVTLDLDAGVMPSDEPMRISNLSSKRAV